MRTYIDKNTNIKMCGADSPSPAQYVVTAVVPEEDYTILVSFVDGSRKRYDVKPLINRYDAFKKLEDMDYFRRAHADGLTVAWDDTLDIAPESLYTDGVTV